MIKSMFSISCAAHGSEPRDYRASHLHPTKAGSYDSLFVQGPYESRESIVWAWEQETLCRILRTWYPTGPRRLLDFACGTGRILSFLEPFAANAVGIDISDAMIAIAQTKVRRSQLIVADVTRQHLSLGSPFDLITAFRFFLNAQEDLRRDVLLFFAGHLAPGGRVVFNIHLQRDSLPDLALRILAGLRLRHSAPSLARTEVRRLVSSAGLRIVRTYHWGVLPLPRRHIPWRRFVAFIETCCSRLPFCLPLARNVVFVCAVADTDEPERIRPRPDGVAPR